MNPELELPLDNAAIERILPHRYPLLLVDRITEFESDKRIVGIKNVSLNERFLARPPGGRMGRLKGFARVDGEIVIEGTMAFALGPAPARRPD